MSYCIILSIDNDVNDGENQTNHTLDL